MWAAALLGLVSLILAGQVQGISQSSQAQTAGTQSATKAQNPKVPTSGAQTAGHQGTKPSGQEAAERQSQQTGQTAASQSQPTGQQSPTKRVQPTGKPAAGQTGKQTSGQNAGQKPQAPKPPVIPRGYRLLSLNEGRAIAQGMSWADDEEGLSPDCSHLVHKLYEQAGHPYPYASSLDLYRGTAPFFRVRYAHAGDLVVWRGHVGIVTNPREHSFFSTTSSGARLQSYYSAYWRARGYPHFFRYLTKSPLQTSINHGTTQATN